LDHYIHGARNCTEFAESGSQKNRPSGSFFSGQATTSGGRTGRIVAMAFKGCSQLVLAVLLGCGSRAVSAQDRLVLDPAIFRLRGPDWLVAGAQPLAGPGWPGPQPRLRLPAPARPRLDSTRSARTEPVTQDWSHQLAYKALYIVWPLIGHVH
jgi:hypothetical protein